MTTNNSYSGVKQLPKVGAVKTSKQSLEVSLQVYQGILNGRTQYVIKITNNTGENPFYCKYADLLNSESKKFAELKDDILNQFVVSRIDISKIQREVENLRKENQVETLDEAQTRLYLGVYGHELEQEAVLSKEVIDNHYCNIIDFIIANIEFFPVRNLSKEVKPNEGYIDKESFGAYIADEQGLSVYDEEVIAISRQCVQDLITKNTTEFSNITKRLMELGYFVDSTTNTGDLKQIKLRYKVVAKRMYLIRIGSNMKMGYES